MQPSRSGDGEKPRSKSGKGRPMNRGGRPHLRRTWPKRCGERQRRRRTRQKMLADRPKPRRDTSGSRRRSGAGGKLTTSSSEGTPRNMNGSEGKRELGRRAPGAASGEGGDGTDLSSNQELGDRISKQELAVATGTKAGGRGEVSP